MAGVASLLRLVLLSELLALQGCATAPAVVSVANMALEMSGLKKPNTPELPDAQKPPRTIPIKLHAAQNLNTDASGRPLALIARIYKLKQSGAFQQATYDTFLNPQKEKDALGADLLEVKEVTLIPGQRYEISEKVTREAYFVGVVALFRAPAAQRWRATFASADAEKSGILLGLYACALNPGSGAPALSNDNASGKIEALGGVRCQ